MTLWSNIHDRCAAACRMSRMRELQTYSLKHQTIMFVDLQGFTQQCAKTTPDNVGRWITSFYQIVEKTCKEYRVLLIECRGDCCICATEGQQQVTRMLSFSEEVYTHVCSIVVYDRGGHMCATSCKMGVASGEASYLLSTSSDDLLSFTSVQGDVVNVAARLQSMSRAGHIYVHETSINEWAKETGKRLPHTKLLKCKGKPAQVVATYDCIRGSFEDPDPDNHLSQYLCKAIEHISKTLEQDISDTPKKNPGRISSYPDLKIRQRLRKSLSHSDLNTSCVF